MSPYTSHEERVAAYRERGALLLKLEGIDPNSKALKRLIDECSETLATLTESSIPATTAGP